MQTKDKTHGESFAKWGHLVTAVADNAADLPHLEAPRAKLAAMLAEGQDITAKQAALAASKQDASKRLQEIVNSGRRLASFLRSGVREHYGSRAEKLTEFNVQPFRGRKLKATPASTPTPPAAPSHNP